MSYRADQGLNQWVIMLHSIYGSAANYSKSQYEILSHLVEVTGGFGRFMFKRKEPDKAKDFLPRMFGWSLALLKKVKGPDSDLEKIILSKFPQVCFYCAKAPCECWNKKKPSVDEHQIKHLYYENPLPITNRSLNDFQRMFRDIYEDAWGLKEVPAGSDDAFERLRRLHTRLVEEISEVAEAVRFYHLYPSNFDNEFADFMAWWFALISSVHKTMESDKEAIHASEFVWYVYRACCPVCLSAPCDCRPGPVREMLSKPAIEDLWSYDQLTQAGNEAKFERDVDDVQQGALLLATPIACIRIDVDNLAEINKRHTKEMGNEVLKYLATTIRQKKHTRDRLYRLNSRKFAMLCPDLSAAEATGMMNRVANAIKERPLFKHSSNRTQAKIPINLSIGIADCINVGSLRSSLTRAEDATSKSKEGGKNKITVYK